MTSCFGLEFYSYTVGTLWALEVFRSQEGAITFKTQNSQSSLTEILLWGKEIKRNVKRRVCRERESEWRLNVSLLLRELWVVTHGPGGFPLFSLLDISDSLRYADTFVQSTIHNLDLTSASGLGELSLNLNTLLEASNDLHKEDCLFLNTGTLTRHSLLGITLCLFSGNWSGIWLYEAVNQKCQFTMSWIQF